MPSAAAVRILFVSANPAGAEALASDVEARQIRQALRSSKFGGRFDLDTAPATRIGDLSALLRDHQPHILHIAVHGSANGGLTFNDPQDWQSQDLAADDLAGIVAAYQAEAVEKLRLVVLAGCDTQTAAQLVSRHVDCVLGTTGDVTDRAVIRLSPDLYAALGDGRSVGNALESALAELRGHGMNSDADLFALYPRTGVDPHKLILSALTTARLTPAHLDYLRRWFGKGWATVNLADISQRQERASLLDVYVPLPVDFKLDIEVAEHQIVDWWVHRETGEETNAERRPEPVEGAQRSRGAERNRAFGKNPVSEEAAEPSKERVWADLGEDEAALQTIVDGIQAKIFIRKEKGEETKDGTHRWLMEAHDAASVQPRFVLLGEPGGGKSSFLRHLALCLAGELRRRAGDPDVPANASLDALRDWLLDVYTPVYIELRALVASHFPPLSPVEGPNTRLPDADDFWRYIREDLTASGLAGFETELRNLCGDGEAILLLDGLDEIPQAGDERRQKQVKGFVASLLRAYPRLRVIVTSRPHAYRRGEWALDGFGRAELEPLLPSRLYELAQALFRIVTPNVKGNEAASFIRTVENAPHVEKDLHRNPLFFTLLAALWLNPDAPRQLPATRADLYRQAVDLLLGRWTRRRAPDASVAENLGILNPAHLRPVLESLACAVNEQRNPQEDATLFKVETLLGILFRGGFQTGLHDVPDYLTQHAGILVSPTDGEFVFVHRSFQEHLAACELTHPRPAERTPPVPAERRFPQGLVGRVIERPDLWENVARLAADELIAQQRENDLWRLLVEMVRPYLRSSTSSEKSNFSSDGAQAAFLALEIVRQHNLLAVERDEFDPLAHSFGLLRQVALAVLTDFQSFEPEQRLIAGQLLGARPGLDDRRGVGVVETQNFASLPDIDWVKIPQIGADGQSEFIYQDAKRESPDDFWMARYPITYAQFQTFIDAADGWPNPRWWEGLSVPDEQREKPFDQYFPVWNHPRETVSWYQAIAFCRWLTEQVRQHPELLPACRGSGQSGLAHQPAHGMAVGEGGPGPRRTPVPLGQRKLSARLRQYQRNEWQCRPPQSTDDQCGRDVSPGRYARRPAGPER